jgi:hypothetical protein
MRTSAECPPQELEIFMARDLAESALSFAVRYGLALLEPLDSGVHGIVHVVQSNAKGGRTALKIHHSQEFYRRELEVYLRLQETGVWNPPLGRQSWRFVSTMTAQVKD